MSPSLRGSLLLVVVGVASGVALRLVDGAGGTTITAHLVTLD